MNIEAGGEIFIPAGANFGDLESQIATKVNKDMSGYDSKTTPVDNDLLAVSDSADGFSLKKLSWANLKATLLTYFDTLYTRTTAIFGIGQTLQTLMVARALNTDYTNITDKTIILTFSLNSTGNTGVFVVINGTSHIIGAFNAGGMYGSFTIPIPAGATYRVSNGAYILYQWQEFR